MKKWSIAAVKFLRDNYQKLTDQEICNTLNSDHGMAVNVLAVQRKRHRLGYIKPQAFRWDRGQSPELNTLDNKGQSSESNSHSGQSPKTNSFDLELSPPTLQ